MDTASESCLCLLSPLLLSFFLRRAEPHKELIILLLLDTEIFSTFGALDQSLGRIKDLLFDH